MGFVGPLNPVTYLLSNKTIQWLTWSQMKQSSDLLDLKWNNPVTYLISNETIQWLTWSQMKQSRMDNEKDTFFNGHVLPFRSRLHTKVDEGCNAASDYSHQKGNHPSAKLDLVVMLKGRQQWWPQGQMKAPNTERNTKLSYQTSKWSNQALPAVASKFPGVCH